MVTSSVGGLGTFRGPETLLLPITLIGKPKTSQLQNASLLKFAPLKVVLGLFDMKKKLYKCPFGPEPIAGAKIPERFPCSMQHTNQVICVCDFTTLELQGFWCAFIFCA